MSKMLFAWIFGAAGSLSAIVGVIAFVDLIADGMTVFTSPGTVIGYALVCMVVGWASAAYLGYKFVTSDAPKVADKLFDRL